MHDYNKLISIFCDVDDFCIDFIKQCNNCIFCFNVAFSNTSKKLIDFCPSCNLSLSEVMTITIFFHLSHYRTFKNYSSFVKENLASYFPKLVSYNRFVELMQSALLPLLVYTKTHCLGKCTGISFIDSTTLDVCDNKRISSHKVFKDIAERGKSSTGWFYGFKLHIIINDIGEILSFYLTIGNTDDRSEKVIGKEIYGYLFGDKGYLSKELYEKLKKEGIKLITKLKKNKKNKLMRMEEKMLLRKRAIIEVVNDFLKNTCYIEHSRHRSFINFCVNIVSGITAYSYIEGKPSIFKAFPKEDLALSVI